VNNSDQNDAVPRSGIRLDLASQFDTDTSQSVSDQAHPRSGVKFDDQLPTSESHSLDQSEIDNQRSRVKVNNKRFFNKYRLCLSFLLD
jgi:hypothetical protein